ncbi:MAG: S8 family peptidase [Bacteroidia bacterium]
MKRRRMIFGITAGLSLFALPINAGIFFKTVFIAFYTFCSTNLAPGTGGESIQAEAGNEAFFNESIYVNPYAENEIVVAENRHLPDDLKLPLKLTLPNDLFADRQWYIQNTASITRANARVGADLGLLQAWEIEDGDSLVVVAILDGGTDILHPDLEGRIWKNTNEIPFNNIDDDLNGFVDDTAGWDFVNNDNFPEDETGHGTNIAGIIGAKTNNEIGYAGIDKHCRLMICKITDENGNGKYKDWTEAIYYAVNNGARIINMSVGGITPSKQLTEAINFALANNVVVVSSMMNNNSGQPYYPAAIPGVIAVGATNPDDSRAEPFFWSDKSGSNFGNHISVVAPGNYIYGLSPIGDNFFWGGTSQAAPMVAGLAALLIAQDMSRTPAEIKHIIEITSDDNVGDPVQDLNGWDMYYGFGRINAYKALKYYYNPREMEQQARGL